MANDKILGVLGGMGPLASAQFMLRLTLLTPAERDQEHIPAILWSDPRIPDRMAAKFANGEDPLPWFLRAVRGEIPRPVVTAEEAIRALDLALAVERALEDAGPAQ